MLHVLVDEQPVLVLAAVAHQLHQVGVPQLPQEDHLRLHHNEKDMPESRQNQRVTPGPAPARRRKRARWGWATQLIRAPVPPDGARNSRDRSTTTTAIASA